MTVWGQKEILTMSWRLHKIRRECRPEMIGHFHCLYHSCFVLICFMLTFVLCCPLFCVGFCFVSTFSCWLLFLSIFFALTFVLCQLFSHGPLFRVNFCFVLTFSCWLLLTCKTKEVAAWLWTLSRRHVFSGPRDVKITFFYPFHRSYPVWCVFRTYKDAGSL